MSDALTCAHGPLSLSIDFTAAEEGGEAVRANILVTSLGTNERLECALYEVWIAEAALARFEAQLAAVEDAVLTGTHGEPLLRVVSGEQADRIDLGCPLPALGTTGQVFASIATPPGLKQKLALAFLDYPRWW